MGDTIFSGAMKVYSSFSARRFDYDIRDAHSKGFISTAPSFNSVNRSIADPELAPIIKGLVELSAAPLTDIEYHFSADSSGFSTCRFDWWYDENWGKEKSQRKWMKAHIVTGTRTNIITVVEITPSHVNDSPILPGLLDTTGNQFHIAEVSADKAYLSKKNLRRIGELRASPFISFKSNTTGQGSPMWRRFQPSFILDQDNFKNHYNRCSNVDTTFSMVKGKFGNSVRSRLETGQVNEILLKCLCHNICVLGLIDNC